MQLEVTFPLEKCVLSWEEFKGKWKLPHFSQLPLPLKRNLRDEHFFLSWASTPEMFCT